MYTLSRILVPVDFSPCSRAALEYAAFLAERFGADLDVLHAWQRPSSIWEPQYPLAVSHHRFALFEGTDAAKALEDFLAPFQDRDGVKVRGRLESGDPYMIILDLAAEDTYDLIVMGTHGRTGMSHVLLGSLAEAIVRRAPCPVLTVRGVEPDSRPAERSRRTHDSDPTGEIEVGDGDIP